MNIAGKFKFSWEMIPSSPFSGGRSFSVAGRFFFARELIVPCVVAQAQLTGQGLGFSNTDFPTIVQKFLHKRVIGGFFGNMLHDTTLATAQAACHPQITGNEALTVQSITNAGKDFTKSSTAFICVKNGLIKSKGRALGPSHKA